MPKEKPGLPIIGWREWVRLPELGIKQIKVKVDSGARTSSLHAIEIQQFERNGEDWVRFKVHPVQRNADKVITVESKVLEIRSVRSSSGKATLRPVIVTDVELLEFRFPVELTLADRNRMGFRMLLGREAFRGRFLADGGKSYYGGKPKKRPAKSKNKAHKKK